jgi:hypothetical protein
MSACAAVVDAEFLPKGLHDIGEAGMSSRIQAAIDATDPACYDAILLAYGLCNYGVRGLHAELPVVVPRAHDCITLLLGSRQRYAEYFAANPGTFFKSPGWIERDVASDANPASITSRLGMSRDRETLAARYGEENADFLMAAMGDWMHSYRKLAFIDTGVGDTAAYLKITEEQARDKGWEIERVAGSRVLLERLLSGDWSAADFLVLAPGEKIDASWDEGIIRSLPASAGLPMSGEARGAPLPPDKAGEGS